MNKILLLHGALGAEKQLQPLRDILADTFEVHSLSFSGHGGRAFGAHFGIEAFAEDVAGYLHEKNLRQVPIFGYSMGGYVALWLAATQPELVGAITCLGTKFDWSPESAAQEVKKLNPEKIEEKIPAFARILEHRHAPVDWKVLLHKTKDMMLGLGNRPLLTPEVLHTIRQHTVIALGDLDDMADKAFSEKVAQWLPNADFVPLENTPHPIEKVSLEVLAALLKQHVNQ
jgi:pimeloyl-ACP methyl ester carboxylesterase